MPMKINIDPVVASRIQAAWNQLPADKQAKMAAQLLAANQQALYVVQTGKAPDAPAEPHHLMFAHSVLTQDRNAVVTNLEAGVVIDVGPDGAIWGTGKWEQLDPGWVEAFAVFLENIVFGSLHPFNTTPPTVAIPSQVQIGLAGDWGTGDWRMDRHNPAPSTDVKEAMNALKLDVTVHLGDVYYAGTGDEEQHLLVPIWPVGQTASFALNSNHEMYSGSKPYFKAISNPPFDKQAGCSYFALQNADWVIVGLDSAYFSSDDDLYMNGLLFPDKKPNAQNAFLQSTAADAQVKGKKLIILTHHNGLDDAGVTPNQLFAQVMNCMPNGFAPSYWYWGHVHAAAVYKAASGVLCRVCGHGALPWGHASILANSPQVEWFEDRNAHDPDIPERVLNGFAVLQLDGPNIKEAFYDENGGTAWKSS